MDDIIIPPVFPEKIRAFFTTKKSHSFIYKYLNFPVYLPLQRHTPDVIILDGMERRIADGVITDKRGIVLGVEVADCIPVLICDPLVPVVGAVHAGWRGTAQGIIKNAIRKLKETFSSDPSKILIAIGPSIGPCCYEVDEPVMKAITSQTGSSYQTINGKYYIDLKRENLKQALAEGVLEKNIWISEDCTRCNHERFHSFRYHRNTVQRQGGFILIEI